MGKGRLEAFSDGVLAIIITIMVLELKVPHGDDLAALRPVCAVFASYVVSFVYVAIYWNNHHHLLHVVKKVDGWIMWANMHLLFWLSLIPAMTGWIGEHPAAAVPTAGYGIVLFMAGIAWLLLQRAIIHRHGEASELRRAIGSDSPASQTTSPTSLGSSPAATGCASGTAWHFSGVVYLAAIGLAFVANWISIAIYVVMAIVWIVPDRRISRVVDAHEPA